MKNFSHELRTTKTRINGLWAYLGTGDIDFDDLEVKGEVNFTLTPDVTSWGWDGVKAEITDVDATVIWKVYNDGLSESEKGSLINAGGVETSGRFFEGVVKINFTPEWKVFVDLEISNVGVVSIQQVEFDLCNEKSKVTLSIL